MNVNIFNLLPDMDVHLSFLHIRKFANLIPSSSCVGNGSTIFVLLDFLFIINKTVFQDVYILTKCVDRENTP